MKKNLELLSYKHFIFIFILFLSFGLAAEIEKKSELGDFLQFYAKAKISNIDLIKITKIYNNSLQPFLNYSNKNPRLIVLAGSPGAGKSTLALELRKGYKHAFLHEVDNLAFKLAILHDDVKNTGSSALVKAVNKWRPEATNLADIIVEYALLHKLDIIYDRTCNKESCKLFMQQAKENGYQVILYGIKTAPELAYQRMQARAVKTGNRNSYKVIENSYIKFIANWPELIKLADRWFLYDNSSSSSPFKLIDNGG